MAGGGQRVRITPRPPRRQGSKRAGVRISHHNPRTSKQLTPSSSLYFSSLFILAAPSLILTRQTTLDNPSLPSATKTGRSSRRAGRAVGLGEPQAGQRHQHQAQRKLHPEDSRPPTLPAPAAPPSTPAPRSARNCLPARSPPPPVPAERNSARLLRTSSTPDSMAYPPSPRQHREPFAAARRVSLSSRVGTAGALRKSALPLEWASLTPMRQPGSLADASLMENPKRSRTPGSGTPITFACLLHRSWAWRRARRVSRSACSPGARRFVVDPRPSPKCRPEPSLGPGGACASFESRGRPRLELGLLVHQPATPPSTWVSRRGVRRPPLGVLPADTNAHLLLRAHRHRPAYPASELF